jgi:hypothetical protein
MKCKMHLLMKLIFETQGIKSILHEFGTCKIDFLLILFDIGCLP